MKLRRLARGQSLFGRGGGERLVYGVMRHGAAAALAAVFALPLVWMVAVSLRQPGLPPPRAVEWVPDPVVWDNYARVFALVPLGRYALNSLAVAGMAVPVTLITASWAGFAIAQLDARRRTQWVWLSIGLLAVPVTAVWLTRYVIFKWLGLIDTYAALAAPALMGSSPLFVLLFYWAFRRVPLELYESARLEGAGALAIWRRVALPMAQSTAVAVGLLAFLLYWGDFISPLLYLKSQSLYTLPLGLRQLQQLDVTNWPLLMAGSVVMTLPSILVFLVVQRYFLQENRLSGIYG